jgi:ubiquinone/menaquinone biosynthesis C-methylase UbiE
MRTDAISLEETRLQNVHDLGDYSSIHERHRIFPAVFEDRGHRTIIDIAAGVGVVGKRIQSGYEAPGGELNLVCNDICPTCLRVMNKNGLQTISFSIDDEDSAFPFSDETFDAVIALATIEHVIHTDHFLSEICRILRQGGCFYVSAPNYTGLTYLLPFLWSGRTFHNPMSPVDRYEFYAHVRYFTYRTLCEFVSSFGFVLDAVYIGVPQESSRYQALRAKSKLKALAFRTIMKGVSIYLSPRWASEPVLCFRKSGSPLGPVRARKVVL